MSTSFQCPHCPQESSEDISDIVSSVNEMSLDDEDFSRINEFQIIREENSQVFYQYESDQDYAGDISFGEISHSSNIPEEYENFDEILPASLQSNEEPVSYLSNIPEEYENFDEILPANYFVHYRPIKNCIKNLLSNPDILKNLMFRYENSKIEDEKSYGEQNSGNWWKRAERSISNHANILSIILYSDATTTDTLGKSSLHPIYKLQRETFKILLITEKTNKNKNTDLKYWKRYLSTMKEYH
ncbi:hypothetical protein Glove_136g116 [Diversispora epigaea]|uniref:Uncharacterized protein n=1 Tax=Diversispora epigaea TaxID=1348612 RepID=A0A397IWM0_9GLOM|nr:hypothetical protein Glove_136g116 [Diversispora epigaea]